MKLAKESLGGKKPMNKIIAHFTTTRNLFQNDNHISFFSD